jgi:hypothetical protein
MTIRLPYYDFLDQTLMPTKQNPCMFLHTGVLFEF